MPTPSIEVVGAAALAGRVWERRGPFSALLSLVLLPAEGLYRIAVSVRNLAWDRGWMGTHRAPLRVVSIGNLAVGGTGKTPMAAWVAARLLEAGERPAVLHGGYAEDEPELHRRWNAEVPVLVGRDRVASARTAAGRGATVAVLDDGFQHRRLARDVELVLVAAETWKAPRALLPRGPWREPATALRRAHAVIITRKTADTETAGRVAAEVRTIATTADVCVAALRAGSWVALGTAGERPAGPCVAVAGIASPDSFLANARDAGAFVTEALVFGDHHEYTPDDVRRIQRTAGGRGVVTTEKDAIKLETIMGDTPMWVLRQEVDIEEGESALLRRLRGERQ